MKNWPDIKKRNQLASFFRQDYMQEKLTYEFDLAYSGKINTWDIQWVYSCLFQNALSVVPKTNLISNIGVSGTHTNEDTKNNFFPTFKLNTTELIHPPIIHPEITYEDEFFLRQFKPKKKKFKLF